MDYTLQADSEHRILLVTLGERVTEASALAAYSAVERFNAAQAAHSGVTDLSKVEKLDVSTGLRAPTSCETTDDSGWHVARRGGFPARYLRVKPDVPDSPGKSR